MDQLICFLQPAEGVSYLSLLRPLSSKQPRVSSEEFLSLQILHLSWRLFELPCSWKCDINKLALPSRFTILYWSSRGNWISCYIPSRDKERWRHVTRETGTGQLWDSCPRKQHKRIKRFGRENQEEGRGKKQISDYAPEGAQFETSFMLSHVQQATTEIPQRQIFQCPLNSFHCHWSRHWNFQPYIKKYFCFSVGHRTENQLQPQWQLLLLVSYECLSPS